METKAPSSIVSEISDNAKWSWRPEVRNTCETRSISIMALAGPSEVFASAITFGLADGSGLAFEDQGQREVKGLDRPIAVYRLA